MTVTNKSIDEIRETWTLLFPDIQTPPLPQFAMWGLLHDGETIKKGLVQLAGKYRTLGGEMTDTHMVKFISSVMNRLSRERSSTTAVAVSGK